MALTKLVSIKPEAAAAAGCLSLCLAYQEDGHEEIPYTDTQDKGHRFFKNYYLWASGTRHWKFKQFSYDWENTDLNKDGTTSSQSRSTTSSRNPYPSSLSISYPVRPSDYYSVIPSNHSQAMYSGSFSNVVAEFEYIDTDPIGQYFIETTASPAGGCLTFGDGWYSAGDTCKLLAVPNSGYEFSHWSDGSTSPEMTFSVSGNATYTAYFVESEDSSSGDSSDSPSDDSSDSPSDDSSEESEDGPLLYNPATGNLRYNPLTNHLRYRHIQSS